MPATSTATNPKGVTITFTEADHKYVTPDIDDFISSSTIVHHFFEPFDMIGTANRIAGKRGTTPEALLQEWEDNKNRACDFGTRTHENCEYQFANRLQDIHTPRNEKEQNTFSVAWDAVAMLQSKYTLIGCELIVFSERFRLAGTIDLLMYDPVEDTYWILDWKTNKQIDFKDRYGKLGKNPIQYLSDCNGTHYALQLSIYEFIMRHEGYLSDKSKIKRAIIHLKEDKPYWHELPDMSKEVALMIMFYNSRDWELIKGLPF